MYGTGLKGSGLDMIRNAEDTRLRHRLHFYFDRGEGIHPESGVGGQLHRVELKNLYDADDDPLKVRRGDAFTLSSQSAILDAGFDGFMFRIGNQSGFAILLGDHVVNVDQLGQQAGSFKGSRVAPPSARMRWSRDEPFYSALADQIAGINVKGRAAVRLEGCHQGAREQGSREGRRSGMVRPGRLALAAAGQGDEGRCVVLPRRERGAG